MGKIVGLVIKKKPKSSTKPENDKQQPVGAEGNDNKQ